MSRSRAAGEAPRQEARDPLERIAETLRSHNIEAVIVDTADQAREAVLRLIPEGARVHSGKSRTLVDVGLFAELMESGRFDALRGHLAKMDRATQATEMRALSATPDFMLGSVAAVTDDGALVAVSATGSQLGAYVYGAGHVILVVGSQKVVPDLEAAMTRIREVALPYENAQVQAMLGVDTRIEKVLVIYGEWRAGRTTVVLVREAVGV